jgi:hypothetical protein
VVGETVRGIESLIARAVEAGEIPPSTDVADLAERTHVVVEGYLLHTAASAGLADQRTTRQMQTSLAALYATAPARR